MSRIYLGFAVCRLSESPESRAPYPKRGPAERFAGLFNRTIWKPGAEPFVVKPIRPPENGLSAVTADQ